jgi:hypothetical protein
MTSREIVGACIASCLRVLDWLEEDEVPLSVETLHAIVDDLEILEERLAGDR